MNVGVDFGSFGPVQLGLIIIVVAGYFIMTRKKRR